MLLNILMHRTDPHDKEFFSPECPVSRLRDLARWVSLLPGSEGLKLLKLTDDCSQPVSHPPPALKGQEVHAETYKTPSFAEFWVSLQIPLLSLTWASREVGRGQARSLRLKWNVIRLTSTSQLSFSGI